MNMAVIYIRFRFLRSCKYELGNSSCYSKVVPTGAVLLTKWGALSMNDYLQTQPTTHLAYRNQNTNAKPNGDSFVAVVMT